MADPNQQKSGGKSARSGKKRNKKAQPAHPAPEQARINEQTAIEAKEAIERAAAVETTPIELAVRVASFSERMASVAPPADAVSAKAPAPAAAQPAPAAAAAPAAGIQAIANAYRDYTRKSLEDAKSYAEQLSAVRSFDQAVEVQAEFAKKACETFVADARKIRELFWQTFRLPSLPPGPRRQD